MLRNLLEGRSLRHPLHPLLVHLPIGAFVLSLLLDVGSHVVRDGAALQTAAFVAIALGIVTALLAAVPGLADRTDIRRDSSAWRTVNAHLAINLVVVVLYIADWLWRWQKLEGTGGTPLGPLLLSVAGVVLLGISGYLGGTLVYDDGVGVGRERRRTPLPRETIRVTSRDSQDGFVPVADAASVPDQCTLRVELDSVVMAIVNLDGRFFAFQDFCTHRFAPLSEGAFSDHQVMCPWHRSCFDVRTGKVTQGPAKVDLRTFEVQVRDGKVCVRIPRGQARPETTGASAAT